MNTAASYQLAAAGLLLAMMCVAALALMRADERRSRFLARIGQYATPYARASTNGPHQQTHTTTAITGKNALLKFIALLVAFDPSHQERYPLPWWIVLPVALLLARGLVAAAQILLGGTTLLALPVIWLLIVRRFYRRCETRRLRALFEQFPDALAMLVRAVRVGIPISEGIRSVAAESADPTGREFRLVVDQIAVGVTLEDALYDLAARNGIAEYRFFSTALALQSETGGAVSETLERLADVIRKRVALREHARALAAEARTSIAILAALPVVTGGALVALSPDYISTLFSDPQGRRILTLAVVSLALGIGTMQTIVNRSSVVNPRLLALMVLAAAIFVAAGFILNRQLRCEARLAARMREVQRSVGIDSVTAPADSSQSSLLRLVAGIGEVVTRRGLLSASTLEDLEKRLRAAGFRGRNVLALFVGAKLLLLIALPMIAWLLLDRTAWSSSIRMVGVAGAGIIGLLLPDYLVRLLHSRHTKAVERGLPDALDMLVICSEAGLGLEPAIDRVGREVGHAHPAVAEELLNSAREMRVNADRRVALVSMGARTGLTSLRRLGVTLVQTLQYGTPLSQALRTLSVEMRQEALTRFEARAARLPVLLTLPMIVFILPCVFLIVGGPAVIHIMRALHQ